MVHANMVFPTRCDPVETIVQNNPSRLTVHRFEQPFGSLSSEVHQIQKVALLQWFVYFIYPI